jgi:DTW domain-containing protein YfiP
VVVLQHPMEVTNPKGTARLLHLSLAGSCMVTGEVFDPALLHALITEPLHRQHPQHRPKQVLLLYPPTQSNPLEAAVRLQGSALAAPAALGDPAQVRLIVLDGTWRKSRKMLYQNPALQRLPRLSLQDMPASRYLIRKAHHPDQLSTLEATCAALVQLGVHGDRVQPLLTAFDGFVLHQGAACRWPASWVCAEKLVRQRKPVDRS